MEYNFADVIREKKRMHDQYTTSRCEECPISALNNGRHEVCGQFMERYPEEYAKVVMDWAEKHRVKTNGEVAREMLEEKFGIKVEAFIGCNYLPCGDEDCDNCPVRHFWDKEYTEE